MRRLATSAALGLMVMVLVPGALGCGGGGGGGTGGGGGGGGGGGTGGGGEDTSGPFRLITLDATARDAVALAMAVDPVTERVGIAYFTNKGTQIHAGTPDYDLKYLEWRNGTGITLGPETVRTVQRLEGLSLVFDPAGNPALTYLGGQYDPVVSVSWFQNDAVVNRRSPSGVWTETVLVQNSPDVACGNNISDSGFLTGMWAAMGWDRTGNFVLAYRDCHQGEFPIQDWKGSDIKGVEGPLGGTLSRVCINSGGKTKNGAGGHLKMVMANGQPAIVFDHMELELDRGSNVSFQQRTDAGWSTVAQVATIANTQEGPSLAWDPQEGYGVAVADASADKLWYTHFLDTAHPNTPVPVFGSGSGGWWPSLAMDPEYHEPAIAFYVCGPTPGLNQTQCLASTNELRVTQRVSQVWQEVTVDTEGGFLPQIAFFSSKGGAPPKRVIAYRVPVSKSSTGALLPGGVLKLAVEK